MSCPAKAPNRQRIYPFWPSRARTPREDLRMQVRRRLPGIITNVGKSLADVIKRETTKPWQALAVKSCHALHSSGKGGRKDWVRSSLRHKRGAAAGMR